MQKCPSCGRAGDEIGQCGSFLTCPKTSVPITSSDIVIHCDPCDITRVVAAPRIVSGKPLSAAHMCPRGEDTCACRPVRAAVARPAPALDPKDDAPPITEDFAQRAAIMDGDTVLRPADGTLTQSQGADLQEPQPTGAPGADLQEPQPQTAPGADLTEPQAAQPASPEPVKDKPARGAKQKG